jgi:hypothetical protein
MVIEGVLVTEEKQKRKQIVMKGEEEVLWGLGRENAKTNSFGQAKGKRKMGEEELCLCDERQWGCCWQRWSFSLTQSSLRMMFVHMWII